MELTPVDDRGSRAVLVAGLGFVALVAAGLILGASVLDASAKLNAPPFHADWQTPARAALLVPILAAVPIVAWGPAIAARLPWRAVPLVAGVTGSAWAVALAITDGWSRLTETLTTRFEYEPFAAHLTHPTTFVRTFVDRLPDYPIHVQGHPPGAPLVPYALDRLGLGGAGWLAVLVLGGWAVGLGSVLVGVRRISGEAVARRAAPALVLLPGAVWAATSMDALFTGVLAAGITVAILGRRWQALLGGGVMGVALLLTYGAAVLLLIPVGVLLVRRQLVHVAAFGVGVVGVLLATWLTTGFSWLEGLQATHERYWAGAAAHRPSPYFVALGDPAALAVAVGPAAVVGLAWAISRSAWRDVALPLAAVAAVSLADLSLLSKGEVERIWLPFAVWIGAAALGDRRGWLAAQAAVGVTAQAVLYTAW